MSSLHGIVAIHRNGHRWNNEIKYFQNFFYHGEALPRPDSLGISSHSLDEDSEYDMRIILNCHTMPRVIIPERCTTLVISDVVRQALKAYIPQLAYRHVPVAGVYDIEPDKVNYVTSKNEVAILNLENVPVCIKCKIPQYYEILSIELYKYINIYSNIEHFFTKSYSSTPATTDLIPVSSDMFKKFPIVDVGYPILRYDLYNILKEHMDLRYFGIKSYMFQNAC